MDQVWVWEQETETVVKDGERAGWRDVYGPACAPGLVIVWFPRAGLVMLRFVGYVVLGEVVWLALGRCIYPLLFMRENRIYSSFTLYASQPGEAVFICMEDFRSAERVLLMKYEDYFYPPYHL